MEYNWTAENGQLMQTFTGNPDHIAIMDNLLINGCEEEEPVDTKTKLTKEKKDILTTEELKQVKPLKIKNKKWTYTDPETGIVTSGGDDKEYTVLKCRPDFKKTLKQDSIT